MELASLLRWMLLHVGFVYLVTSSVIFAPVRIILTRGLSHRNVFASFLYCGGCVGFWLGLLELKLGLMPWAPALQGLLDYVSAGAMGMGLGTLFSTWAPQSPANAFTAEQLMKVPHDDEATPNGPSSDQPEPGGGDAGHAGDPRRSTPDPTEGPGAAAPDGPVGDRPTQPAPPGEDDDE